MKTKWLFGATCLLAAVSLQAQPAVQEFRADLAAEFGVVSGRVILAGDELIFMDEGQPDSSFYVEKSEIEKLTTEGNTLTLQLRSPVKDRAGSRTRLTFRLADPAASASISGWQNRAEPVGQAQRSDAGVTTYEARHDKFIGGSRGRLIISDTGLAYESIDDANDSRRWEFRGVKQLKQKGPYELTVEPFNGDKYKLELEGKGMDTDQYNKLVDQITKARALR